MLNTMIEKKTIEVVTCKDCSPKPVKQHYSKRGGGLTRRGDL